MNVTYNVFLLVQKKTIVHPLKSLKDYFFLEPTRCVILFFYKETLLLNYKLFIKIISLFKNIVPVLNKFHYNFSFFIKSVSLGYYKCIHLLGHTVAYLVQILCVRLILVKSWNRYFHLSNLVVSVLEGTQGERCLWEHF